MSNYQVLTPEQLRRTEEALIETERKLNKEMAYSHDLQKQDVIDFYLAHIIKLRNMLLTKVWDTPN